MLKSHAPNILAEPFAAGRGALEIQKVNGRSVATRVMARSPLRLLTPRSCPGNAAWVFTSTFGGGLVTGDEIALHATIGQGASCVLATQSSTKVYRAQEGRLTRQALNLNISDDGTCILLPDPVTCFAGARYDQRVRIEMEPSSSLVLVDWLTSGRRARGERWAFEHYSSRIEAAVGAKLVFRDAILLDQSLGPIDDVHRMGRCDCLGLVLILGPRVAQAAGEILAWAGTQPLHRGQGVIFSASPLPGGAVIRVAGPQTEIVGRWIRQRLGFLGELLEADPWSRKW